MTIDEWAAGAHVVHTLVMELRRLVWDDMVVAFRLAAGLLTSVYTLCTLHVPHLFSPCADMF